MRIHDHPIELYQLGAALIGAMCAACLLYMADKARRLYKASGENDPDIMATAASNIRDEALRLTKHLLLVVVGIVTLVMEKSGQDLTERETVVRWILIMVSTIVTAQSFMVWRDRMALVDRAGRRDRRVSDAGYHKGRRKDDTPLDDQQAS